MLIFVFSVKKYIRIYLLHLRKVYGNLIFLYSFWGRSKHVLPLVTRDVMRLDKIYPYFVYLYIINANLCSIALVASGIGLGSIV